MCYALGLDPDNAQDDFRITGFTMKDGTPQFTFSHTTDGNGAAFTSRIRTLGKARLSDDWTEVPAGGDPTFTFFTVEVELP